MTEIEWPFEEYSNVAGETVVRKGERISQITTDRYKSWPVIVNGFLGARKVESLLEKAGLKRCFHNTTIYHEHCHPFLASGFDMFCAKGIETDSTISRLEERDEVVSIDVQEGSMRFQPTPVEVGGVIEMEVTFSAEDSS